MSSEARPEIAKKEYLEYLDRLRESGRTNMFGARPYLIKAYPELTLDEAGDILTYYLNHGTGEDEEEDL